MFDLGKLNENNSFELSRTISHIIQLRTFSPTKNGSKKVKGISMIVAQK